MPSRRFGPLVLALVIVGSASFAGAAGVEGPTVSAADEQALKSAKLTASGPELLDFFRRRTPANIPEKTLPDLVQQLKDRAPETHNKAFAELVGYGTAAVPLLRQAANDLNNPEAAERARRCLQLIEGPEGTALVGAAARVLAVFKPAGSADVLMAYLPFADNEPTADEVTQTLTAVAMRDGKPEPALLKALEDPVAGRRAAAATVLSQVGGPEHRPAVRKLLQDPKPTVRLRAALALAQASDAEAIPILINLLAELPAEQAKPAEEYLTRLAGEWSLTIPPGSDEVARRLRRDLWNAWWKSTDGPVLLEELRKRTLGDAEREKIAGLIRQLDDYAPATREKAVADLVELGNLAIPLLRQAINNPSSKARERAQQCLQLIDKGESPPLPGAATRLLGLRKPDGATEALLAFLPCAEDENQLNEAQAALGALAYRDGKPDPVLVRALEDKVWQRRAAAAEALCQVGQDAQLQQVRKLLGDAEPVVRLRVALALANARDRQAIPALIALLTEVPIEQGAQAEACLRTLAGEHAPAVSLSSDEGARQKSRDAWTAWWKEHGNKVDLARLDLTQRMLGYTLVIEQYSQVKRSGRVAELDAAGKVRWEIVGLQTAFDALVVPGDRVLIVEQGVSRVSERDFKGVVTWQKQINLPLAVQRLPNGNTFIAGRGQLVEVDRTGKDVYTYNRPNNDIMAAYKMRDGQVVFLTYAWTYHRLDAKNNEVKTYRLGPFQFYTNGIQFLPNDHVLIPEYNANRVVEYNPEGKRVWEASVVMPSSVERLPNGNVLVSSAAGQRIVELNRAGKVVWEHKENFNPWRARRR